MGHSQLHRHHGRHADVARKHYDRADYKRAK